MRRKFVALSVTVLLMLASCGSGGPDGNENAGLPKGAGGLSLPLGRPVAWGVRGIVSIECGVQGGDYPGSYYVELLTTDPVTVGSLRPVTRSRLGLLDASGAQGCGPNTASPDLKRLAGFMQAKGDAESGEDLISLPSWTSLDNPGDPKDLTQVLTSVVPKLDGSAFNRAPQETHFLGDLLVTGSYDFTDSIAISADGRHGYSAGTTTEEYTRMEDWGSPEARLSPDGRAVAITCSDSASVDPCPDTNGGPGLLISRLGHVPLLVTFAASTDNSTCGAVAWLSEHEVICSSDDGRFLRFDVNDLKPVGVARGGRLKARAKPIPVLPSPVRSGSTIGSDLIVSPDRESIAYISEDSSSASTWLNVARLDGRPHRVVQLPENLDQQSGTRTTYHLVTWVDASGRRPLYHSPNLADLTTFTPEQRRVAACTDAWGIVDLAIRGYEAREGTKPTSVEDLSGSLTPANFNRLAHPDERTRVIWHPDGTGESWGTLAWAGPCKDLPRP